MNERIVIGAKLIASHPILMICLVVLSGVMTDDAFLSIAISQTVLAILFFSGYWEFFGWTFRKYFCAIVEFTILLILGWRLQKDLNRHINLSLVVGLSVIQLYLTIELIKIVLVITKQDSKYLDLAFPFRSGAFLITDGGNSQISRLMNYHYYSPTHKKKKTNDSMLYATDIVRITKGKFSFLPKSNDQYPIFNEKIYSPMEGIIVKVENSIPDNVAYSGNYPYNTGNTVVIKKDRYYLLLGHLRKESIQVREGDWIRRNDPIGVAGNSGWTERPHLHMQLIESESSNYWLGKGVCIRYEGQNMYKNRLIKVGNPG